MSATAPASPGQRIVLGFDFGLARIGVAVGHEALGSARELAVVPARHGSPDWAQVAALLAEWRPDLLLVGLPLAEENGAETSMAASARRFARRLQGRFGLDCALQDERLTTVAARSEQLARGGAGAVDSIAARLIVEDWFAAGARQ